MKDLVHDFANTLAYRVGTGFSLYGRAQLDRGFEYVSELMKRTT
jgi:hypothetical protein